MIFMVTIMKKSGALGCGHSVINTNVSIETSLFLSMHYIYIVYNDEQNCLFEHRKIKSQ